MIKKAILALLPSFIKKPWLIYKTYLHQQNIEGKETEAVFNYIYKNNIWKNKESVSGSGSSLAHTQKLSQELPKILRKYQIESILDLPCGDFNWMKEIDLSHIQYIGADIVQAIVQNNQKQYGNAQRKFFQLDIIKDDLPSAELLLCRDCLVHLSIQDIEQSLDNIRRHSFKYLLLTSFPQTQNNRDILTGNWRPLNMAIPPFNLNIIDEFDEQLPNTNIKKHLVLVAL